MLHNRCVLLAEVDLSLLTTMRIFNLARNLPQSLRAALAVLLLVFAINAVADAGHHHDRTTAAHASACGYCATFTGITDAPVHATALATLAVVSHVVRDSGIAFIARRTPTTAQPRAPPCH